jgi:uncharacterized protein
VTDQNRRRNIAAEVHRGSEALESAELLLQAGKFADATSRAYYAALHYVRALLLTEGEEPITHRGVQRLLARDFVRRGRFDPNLARTFSSLEKFRLDADYASETVATAEGANRDVEVARAIVDAVRVALVAGHWIEAP